MNLKKVAMKNKLALLDNKIKIKEIPEEELNKIILTSFLSWIADLLSLTDEVSAQRLETALPAVKVHCWSMGFDEIKKMFEMYVDNKLSVKPIPNYFDRILFGKIVAAYKEQKPVKKKEVPKIEISETEKKQRTIRGILNCFKDYQKDKTVMAGYVWVYDYLDKKGIINFSAEIKKQKMITAKKKEKSELDPNKAGYKNKIEMIESKNSSLVINRAKRLLLEDYFNTETLESLTQKIK